MPFLFLFRYHCSSLRCSRQRRFFRNYRTPSASHKLQSRVDWWVMMFLGRVSLILHKCWFFITSTLGVGMLYMFSSACVWCLYVNPVRAVPVPEKGLLWAIQAERRDGWGRGNRLHLSASSVTAGAVLLFTTKVPRIHLLAFHHPI